MSTQTPSRDAQPRPTATYATPKFQIYTALVAMFATLMVVSNILATKGVVFFPQVKFGLGPLQVDGIYSDGAFWLFPATYVIGDVISEVYGFKAMRRSVLIGFVAMVTMTVAAWIGVGLPAATPEYQDHFAAVLGVVPWILAASIVGFVAGELTNSFVLTRMKARTGERQLFPRLWSSSLAGQFVDTLAFAAIAATALQLDTFGKFVSFFVVGFVWKLLVETLMMPVTMAVIAWVKRNEPAYGGTAH